MQQAFYIFALAASLFSLEVRASVPSRTAPDFKAKIVVNENVDLAAVIKKGGRSSWSALNEQFTGPLREHQTALNDYTIMFKIKDGQWTVQKTAL